MKKESNIQNAISLALSDAGVMPFRNNIGMYRSEQGHYIRYGVGGKGGSDLICITPVAVTADMVGQTVGVFTALEIKTKTGKPSAEQLAFQSAVRRMGGIAGIARSVEDALNIVNKPE